MARRTMVGRVIGDKQNKTVTVSVERPRPHPLYRKIVRWRTSVKAHDEADTCRVGDTVRIEESRPVSKTKHWIVTEIVTREDTEEVQINDPAV